MSGEREGEGVTHLDLFSGIGGFALAARWMGWETVQFVEIDKFCQQVLKKHWPNVPIHGDIKTFDGTKFRGAVDIITGGFPCQPFSTAGKRKGKDDDRYLWPEMLRVIREVRPSFIVGENVTGIETLFQYELQSEMEGKIYASEAEANADLSGICERTGTATLYMAVEDLIGVGYTVETFIIPACAVNAPHRRDRVWIVAHAASDDDRGGQRQVHQTDGRQDGQMLPAPIGTGEGLCNEGVTTYTDSTGISVNEPGINSHVDGDDQGEIQRRKPVKGGDRAISEEGTASNTERNGLQGRSKKGDSGGITGGYWQNFPTQPPIRSGNDGLSSGLVRSAIKGAGNAVVPVLVYEIFKAIEQVR